VHLEIQGALFGSGFDVAGIPVELTFQHYWPKSNGGEASILELGKSRLHSNIKFQWTVDSSLNV
jgi:hypothetical protein